MNVTKNKLIEALNYLGEFPKISLKKDELIEKLNQFYDKNIKQLATVINVDIYNLIKRLAKEDENGIDVNLKYELEVNFLESILIIEESIIDNNKIHIRFHEGMKNKLAKFINNENEKIIKKNQIIVDMIINIVDIYGLIKDYELLDMLNKFLDYNINMSYLIQLINLQIDLRNEIIIGDTKNGNEIYLMTTLISNPEEIIYERERRDLYYKEYTKQELNRNIFESLVERREVREVIEFLKKKKVEFAKEATITMIMYIMNIVQIDVNDFMELIKIDFKDIDEAKEYLRLVMNLHNNIPHYSLYGYSPNELLEMQLENSSVKEERKKSKIGRNDPCPCGNEEELKEKYDNGEINLYITKQDSKYIINTDGSDNSTFASSLMETYFNTYKQFMQQNYLQENNINPNEVLNIITVEENVLEQDNYFADYIKNYAFLFIMMAITVSATYPATDTTAGERERGTLETLLTFPIKSRDIIVGKFLGVTVSSIITGLISLALAIISLMITKNMFSIYEGMEVMYSPITILFAVIVIIAYSFFISGLCIAIASTSKTFKEAQSALTPLTFISFFPGMIAFMMGITTTPILSIVPFLNFTLIFTDINNGTINLLNIGLMAISTIIYISLVFAHIIKQYKSEKVLFAK